MKLYRFYESLRVLACVFVGLVVCLGESRAKSAEDIVWSDSEIEQLRQFDIQQLRVDKLHTTVLLNNVDAEVFGKKLFHEKGLSDNQQIACASCHPGEQYFTDNKKTARGVRQGIRNTPSLIGVKYHRWFFWDGAKDSLWAQALASIENPDEQGMSRVALVKYIAGHDTYKQQYQALFKELLPGNEALVSLPDKAGPNGDIQQLMAWKALRAKQKDQINRIFTRVGKVIASYVATITIQRTAFDHFLQDVVQRGKSNSISHDAQAGLRLFLSPQSGCLNCHHSALFSNREFHNIGTGRPGYDNGRAEVIGSIITDRFNCLGPFSDVANEECTELTYMNRDKHSLLGSYKTPTLRGIGHTAPYMHDGRYSTLEAVISHYVNTARQNKVTHLPPIDLNQKEQQQLVEFLKTL